LLEALRLRSGRVEILKKALLPENFENEGFSVAFLEAPRRIGNRFSLKKAGLL
jgi:hypothetical protein